MIRRVDLRGVVAAPAESPDLVVGPVLDHRGRLGVLAEEVLPHECAVVRLERLVLPVDALLHQPAQPAVLVSGQEGVPVRPPDHLDHVPAGTTEVRLELLDDLPVAAHRPVEPLEVAVDDEDQVVEPLASGERDGAHRLGLVHLPVAHEGPHLAVARVDDPPRIEVLHEARLVDRHQRAEAHRDRRELPEAGHQPRVRVRRQPAAADLLPEAMELVLAQAALEERPCVEARRRVALEVDEIAELATRPATPEVVEADLVQRLRRLIAGDVTSELRRLGVRLEDDRDRVPADERRRQPLELRVAGELRLVLGEDRVDVWGREACLDRDAEILCVVDDRVEQLAHAVAPVGRHDRVDRVEPLPRLDGIPVVRLLQHAPKCSACGVRCAG